MRTLLVAVLLAALAAPSAARADVVGILTPIERPPVSGPAPERSLSMKRHGMAASILGIVQLVIGSAAGIAFIRHGDIVALGVAGTFTGLGAISASAGVPMWIYGAREVDRAKLSLSASASGLTLRF